MPEERVKVSPNFYLDEFQGKEDSHEVTVEDIDPKLLDHLELMRYISWDEPIVVEDGGGYRSSKYNTKVGGVKNSSHRRGRGGDLNANGGAHRARLVVAHVLACGVEAHAFSKEKARNMFKMIMEDSFGGLGIADGFIHVDVEEPGGDLPKKGYRPGTWPY